MDFSSNLFTSSSSVADTMPSFRTHFHPSPSLKSFAATAFVTPAADEMDMDGMPSHPNGPSTILVPEQLQSSRVRFNLSFNLDFVSDDAGGTYPYTRSICSATWRKPSHSSSHFYRNPDTFSIPQPSVPPILARPTPLCSSFMPFIVPPTSLPYPRLPFARLPYYPFRHKHSDSLGAVPNAVHGLKIYQFKPRINRTELNRGHSQNSKPSNQTEPKQKLAKFTQPPLLKHQFEPIIEPKAAHSV